MPSPGSTTARPEGRSHEGDRSHPSDGRVMRDRRELSRRPQHDGNSRFISGRRESHQSSCGRSVEAAYSLARRPAHLEVERGRLESSATIRATKTQGPQTPLERWSRRRRKPIIYPVLKRLAAVLAGRKI